jgi:hypothetical protein
MLLTVESAVTRKGTQSEEIEERQTKKKEKKEKRKEKQAEVERLKPINE